MDSRAETLAEKEVGRSMSPSPRPSFNKEEDTKFDEAPTDNEEGSVRNVSDRAPPAEREEDEAEYPTGFRLAAIVVALLFSIFLVSLHQSLSYVYGHLQPLTSC